MDALAAGMATPGDWTRPDAKDDWYFVDENGEPARREHAEERKNAGGGPLRPKVFKDIIATGYSDVSEPFVRP